MGQGRSTSYEVRRVMGGLWAYLRLSSPGMPRQQEQYQPIGLGSHSVPHVLHAIAFVAQIC